MIALSSNWPNWLAPPQYLTDRRVRAQDVDDFNHVNNVVYLGWMAYAAWQHSKHLGFDFDAFRQHDCGFVVTRHEIDYRAACFADDTVTIATWITDNDQKLRLWRRFQLVSSATGQTLAFGKTGFASMRISTGKACRMPVDYARGYPVDAPAAAVFAALP